MAGSVLEERFHHSMSRVTGLRVTGSRLDDVINCMSQLSHPSPPALGAHELVSIGSLESLSSQN